MCPFRHPGSIPAGRPARIRAYAEVLAVLEIVPWSGKSDNPDRPASPMRQFISGQDDLDRWVDIVRVYWLG
jgi:hypothetical protein